MRPRRASSAGVSAVCRLRSGWNGNEPAVAAATCWYLSTWEWLAFRLSGVAVAPLVPDQVVPDRRLVAEAGVPIDRLPPTGRPGTVVGGLTDAAADALGLRPGTPVAGGMVDAFASYRRRRDSWNRATHTTRAARRAGSASTGIVRSRWPADS